MSDDATHKLSREVVESRMYQLRRSGDGGLEIDHSTDSQLVEFDEKATIGCSCGERFRKEETALAHLDDVEAEQRDYDREALLEAYREAKPDNGPPYVPWSVFRAAYGEGAVDAFLAAVNGGDVEIEATKPGIRADGSWPLRNVGRLWLSFNF